MKFLSRGIFSLKRNDNINIYIYIFFSYSYSYIYIYIYIYTQTHLHIDKSGDPSPPVCLSFLLYVEIELTSLLE